MSKKKRKPTSGELSTQVFHSALEVCLRLCDEEMTLKQEKLDATAQGLITPPIPAWLGPVAKDARDVLGKYDLLEKTIDAELAKKD